MEIVEKRRRKKGEGRAQEERKRLRAEGKEYVRSNNALVAGKSLPAEQVRISLSVCLLYYTFAFRTTLC